MCALLEMLDCMYIIMCYIFVVGAQMKLCNEEMFQCMYQLLQCERSSNGMKATAVYLINSLIHNNGEYHDVCMCVVCMYVCVHVCVCVCGFLHVCLFLYAFCISVCFCWRWAWVSPTLVSQMIWVSHLQNYEMQKTYKSLVQGRKKQI